MRRLFKGVWLESGLGRMDLHQRHKRPFANHPGHHGDVGKAPKLHSYSNRLNRVCGLIEQREKDWAIQSYYM
jgi:hypothetical protein